LSVGDVRWHTTLNPLTHLYIGILREHETLSAIARVVLDLILTGTSFATLMATAIVNISTDQFSKSFSIGGFLDIIPIQAVTCVVQMLINTHAKGTTRMSDAVIDWCTR